MTSRERLLASLQGRPVDRLAVHLIGVGGNPNDPDPFNVYHDPSWRPLIQLAEEKTDLIWMGGPDLKPRDPVLHGRYFRQESYLQNGSRYSRITVTVAGRELTELSRRDPDINTVWMLEHFLKDEADLKAYLTLPDEVLAKEADGRGINARVRDIGARGLVLIDTGDPINAAADLLGMQDFMILAMTEPALLHALLEKISIPIYQTVEQTTQACPGFLWRVYGPEYATEPFLPPRLFQEFAVRYAQPIINIIHKSGGFVRLHSHGRIKNVLPMIHALGPDALDPLEPPPQGDVELGDVRREYGRDLTLFGNLEVSDIENLPPEQFEKVVAKSIREGTSGTGRGFVLMPSGPLVGRKITARTMTNYETIVRLAGRG